MTTGANAAAPARTTLICPAKTSSCGSTGSGVPNVNFPAGMSTSSRFTPLPRSRVFFAGRFVRLAYCSMDSSTSQRGHVGAVVSAANALAATYTKASGGKPAVPEPNRLPVAQSVA